MKFLTKRYMKHCPPELYYEALTKGNKIQRFWHDRKFSSVLDKIDLTDGYCALDVGCGPGVLLSRISKNLKLAFGLDISKNQVKFTQDLLGNKQNVVGGSQNLPFKENSLNCVFMIEVLEHIPPEEAEKSLISIYRTLKRGGIFLLTTPNYSSLWPLIEFFWNKVNPINYNEQHINKQNIGKLRENLVKCGFKNIDVETIFIISPFLSLFSKKLAERLFRVEKKLNHSGNLIILKAEK